MINTQLKHQTKYITREEISVDADSKKFSVTVHYDLSNQTEDDELREIIECDLARLGRGYRFFADGAVIKE